MSSFTPDPTTVIRKLVGRLLRSVSTNEPGVIESYDPDTGTADVQPSIMVAKPSENGPVLVRQAMVTHAPVVFCGGGGSRLTFPIKRGDSCLLMVASRSLDRWSAFGGEVDPQDAVRHHHITDAIVLVGLTPPAHATPAHATATILEGSDVRLGDDTGSLLSLAVDLQGIVDIFTSWTPVLNDGGAALKTAFTAYRSAHPTWPVGTTKVRAK